MTVNMTKEIISGPETKKSHRRGGQDRARQYCRQGKQKSLGWAANLDGTREMIDASEKSLQHDGSVMGRQELHEVENQRLALAQNGDSFVSSNARDIIDEKRCVVPHK